MQNRSLCVALTAASLFISACSPEANPNEDSVDKTTPSIGSASLAKADTSSGARLYLQCRSCHTLEASGANGVGPNLHGVLGAKAGAKQGYQYSPALAQSGIIWTPEQLDAFLAKPNSLVPGTKMAFAGVASAEARQELIAYLQENQSK